jgi:hypothetical protein
MQTGNGVETEQYLDMDNQPEPESAVQTSEAETEKPAISELLAAAEEFNAAFNTALYELEASRKLAKERAARIEELDASANWSPNGGACGSSSMNSSNRSMRRQVKSPT